MNNVERQKELASAIGKLLRDNFGRGPEAVFVSIQEPFVTVYLKNFLSPVERTLLHENREEVVQTSRDVVMENLIPEVKSFIKFITSIEIDEFYYDWGMHNHSGMFVAISHTIDDERITQLASEDYFGKDVLHEEISNISLQAQKLPEEIISYELNERTVLVIRKGILVSIEREFIRLGKREVLRIAKRNLEKRLLHNNMRLESIFDKKINDSFVSWDFDLDKSVMLFILDPHQRGSNGLDK
ncbi:Na-translocating system protein MpsC family protein [Ornithinibacillus halophilus]|uniref:Uncharacterized protein YbcI n=1 Tax=Ornithinibacillus halophilus TaxID=930117 RepID=A0A1M5EV83_9BACI|nr:Uncharacterized protein YbcI [Ornithinibacillus halophilus]